MQITFDSPMAARAAIMAFMVDHASALDEAVRDKFLLLANEASPVDAIVKVAEMFYANAATVTDEARDLAGSLAAYAGTNYWHGLAGDGRGFRISLAMRRENGETAPEGSPFPDSEADPAPIESMVIELPSEPEE